VVAAVAAWQALLVLLAAARCQAAVELQQRQALLPLLQGWAVLGLQGFVGPQPQLLAVAGLVPGVVQVWQLLPAVAELGSQAAWRLCCLMLALGLAQLMVFLRVWVW
jgi:hypothetical protein